MLSVSNVAARETPAPAAESDKYNNESDNDHNDGSDTVEITVELY